LVATELLKGSKPERFHFASQDFTTAASALECVPKWKSLANRLTALAKQAEAADLLITGRPPQEVRSILGAEYREMSEAGTQLAGVPELGFMTTAIEQELAASRTLGSMVSIVETSKGVPPHPFAFLERLCTTLDWCSRSAPSDWGPFFHSMRLWEGVIVQAAELRAAQAGRGSVRLLQVGSGVLVPFWRIELPYTFETGALWTKRGKEVPETLLVAATFPTDLSSFTGMGSTRVLTDVFGSSQAAAQVGQVFSRLSGKEQKISESGSLGEILQGAAAGSIAGQPAVPPFTTVSEALKLVQSYLDAVRAANPRAASQLRASSPRVVELLYISCSVPGPVPLAWLGALSPKSIGDVQNLLGFVA